MTPTPTTPAAPRPDTSAGRTEALKPSEALRKARELITPEGAWIKGEAAKDELGTPLDYGFVAGAVCFCVIGAIEHVQGKPWHQCSAYPYLIRVMGKHIADWQDAAVRTHAEVLAGYSSAEALALSESR